MLSSLKLSQKLTSPLGLFVNDAKLSFRTQSHGIRKLAESRGIKESDSYWDQYTLLFDSSSDVFSLISPKDIRRAITEAPENVETLIRVITSRLFNLVMDHTFPSSSRGVVSFASSLIKTAAGVSVAERNPTREVLNCIRILSRIFPVLFEGDNEKLEQKILWTTTAESSRTESADGSSQFVIADEDDDEIGIPDGHIPPPQNQSTNSGVVLAEKLIGCLTDLLFCHGFTIPSKSQFDHHKINYIIWEKGVGSTVDAGPGSAFEHNRVEVLRLLLVLLSQQIYSSPAKLFVTPSPYSSAITRKTPRRKVLTVLCSLLNTSMNSSKTNMSTSPGGAIGTVASSLPYNHLVFKGEDIKEILVGYCLQSLVALLDFKSGYAGDIFVATTEDSSDSLHTLKSNAFRYFLAKLHRPSDFEFIAEGVSGILAQHMSAVHNVLPGSRKPVPYVLEAILFLWKTMELNKKFRKYITEKGKADQLVSYAMCFCLEAKDNSIQRGACRAISYMIHSFSSEKAFGLRMAYPIKVSLPAKWIVQGDLGDFMISSIYAMTFTSAGQLSSLYPSLIICLSNLAPYFKNLSVTSSNRLISLLSYFSSPVFLFADEGHPRLLFFLLEAFNGIIMNHTSNPNVIYAILRSHALFEDLGSFTLASGLREVRRAQLAKEQQTHFDSKEGQRNVTSGPENRSITTSEISDMATFARSGSRNSGDLTSYSSDYEVMVSTQPLLSPSSDEFPLSSSTQENVPRQSEKARGKLPSRPDSISGEMAEFERLRSHGVGNGGFVPTQEWVSSWQRGLPLESILMTISDLLPKVEALQASSSKANIMTAIVDLLKSGSLSNKASFSSIPASRRFTWTESSSIWLTSLLWGEIYVRNMTPLGVWNATNVRLFHVKHSQSQSRQLTNAVSSVVGGLGGLLARNNASNSDTLSNISQTPQQ